MKGIVYVLKNPCLRDPYQPERELVKIGITGLNDKSADERKALNRRIGVLSQPTGVPMLFEPYRAVIVDDYKKVEKAIHQAFHDKRVGKREFFRVDDKAIDGMMDLLLLNMKGKEMEFTDADVLEETTDPGKIEARKEEIKARNEARASLNRRQNVKFSEIGIKKGMTLRFRRDPEITAKVHDEVNQVEFEGKIFSTSGAAIEVLSRKGKNYPVAGTAYWEYEGETLWERRNRIDKEKSDSED